MARQRQMSLQQGTITTDLGGGTTETFAEVTKLYGEVDVMRSQTLFVENQQFNGTFYAIKVRYQSISTYFGGITPMKALGNFQLVLDVPQNNLSTMSANIALKILSISNPDLRQMNALLMCIAL